jgi:diguanylate cyclase (GGDEF)-like protein
VRFLVRSWETVVSKGLQALRLERISSKLVAFAVLATLIPSLSTAWVSYVQNKRSLQDKITGQLQNVSTDAQREIDLWLKERLYDLRVFASSYEVTENLARASGAGQRGTRRLTDYLSSVRDRFADYEALVVVDREGQVVASNPAKATAFTLPRTWRTDIAAGNPTVGDVYWDEAAGKAIEVVAVPIRHATGGRLLGAFAAKLNLGGVDHILKRFAPVPTGSLYVITNDGRVVTNSFAGSTKPMRTALPPSTTRSLLKTEGKTVEYRGLDQSRVVGTVRRVPRLNWAVVGEIPIGEAYRQVNKLRNETALIVTALLVGVGLLAYVLGLLIVRPLNRLTQGAALVASGNLDVDLPVTSGGEVGYLTEVFNNMVTRLREGRAELERLSVTDPLTKLHNRRYLMEALAGELSRCRRHRNSATVLMVDVDNFKKYNDAFGHLAGDDALSRVAAALQASIREVDCAARYGGEEFIVVLSETGVDGAQAVTERIRTRLATEVFQGGKITVSIGVAEFPTHGDTPEALLRSADAAMYDAKGQGRNRVARASAPTSKKRA